MKDKVDNLRKSVAPLNFKDYLVNRDFTEEFLGLIKSGGNSETIYKAISMIEVDDSLKEFGKNVSDGVSVGLQECGFKEVIEGLKSFLKDTSRENMIRVESGLLVLKSEKNIEDVNISSNGDDFDIVLSKDFIPKTFFKVVDFCSKDDFHLDCDVSIGLTKNGRPDSVSPLFYLKISKMSYSNSKITCFSRLVS